MTAVDFFCGAGGLSKGLALSGIDVLAGIDNNKSCEETYNRNNTPSKFICEDMRTFTPDDLLALIPRLRRVRPENLLLAGCAPCQPFSQANKSKEPSPDATLLSRFSAFVDYFKPGQVMIENVPGIARGVDTFQRFIEMLNANDYNVVYKPINAKYYGVPQNRVRLVVIAVQRGVASFPDQTHASNPQNGQHPLVTVGDTIQEYPRLEAGQSDPRVPNHTAARVMPINLRRLRRTPHDGGDRRSWPRELILPCHAGEHKGHTDVYGRMYWNRPSPTLTCRCQSISNGRYAHPEQDRAISLREAAALQTFPDDYVFFGPNTSIAAQIGNAVPVRLGQVMGTHFQWLQNHQH